MIPLDSKILGKFLKKAGDQLQGEWILIGGTVLPLLGIDLRTTTDIDLIPLHGKGDNSPVLELMKLAEDLGLPIEVINQAGLYFLEKIPDFKNEMVILHQGKKAIIYRPTVNLFIHLKLGRLSESDLLDCVQFVQLARKINETIDHSRLRKLIEREMKHSEGHSEKQKRLKELKSYLS